MADWVGTVVGLWDVAVRVAKFANDLRSAQDDFVGLRAESECLLICINALNSPSCQDTLYRYINKDQAADLEAIVRNTKLNMMDLNKFICKCWRLVERDVGQNVRKKGWKGLSIRLKERVAKAWARYRFVMTDKQAFRNKLILPTQSINIYLTALTHVGLVNVKFLIGPSTYGGQDGADGDGDRPQSAPSGGNGGGQNGGAVTVNTNPFEGWGAIGRKVAFKDSTIKRYGISPDLEDEVILYARYLIQGGLPFHAHDNPRAPEHKVTKLARIPNRSRSRKRSRSRMYMVRKKSVTKPASDREYRSDSDSRWPRRRRLLALPAPDSPPPDPQYIEMRSPRGSSSASS